jgi:hypothetical protein
VSINGWFSVIKRGHVCPLEARKTGRKRLFNAIQASFFNPDDAIGSKGYGNTFMES